MIAPTWLRISAPRPTPSAANSAQAAVLPTIRLMISVESLPVPASRAERIGSVITAHSAEAASPSRRPRSGR